MLNKKFEYMPKRAYKYVAILLAIIILLPLLILEVVFLCSTDLMGFVHMLLPFLVVVLIVVLLLERSKLKIIFTRDAIYVQNSRRVELKEYRYDTYLFAYYCRSYKGRVYLILSPDKLDKKRLKMIVNFGGGIGATFYDSCVIIYIDENNKQIGEVKKHISENIKNIYKIGNVRS